MLYYCVCGTTVFAGIYVNWYIGEKVKIDGISCETSKSTVVAFSRMKIVRLHFKLLVSARSPTCDQAIILSCKHPC